jgi:endonuclease III
MKPTNRSVAGVLDLLEQHYGAQEHAGPSKPYEMVVYVNCGYPPGDLTCAKGYEALKKTVGTKPTDILAASKATLARLMRLGGIVPELRAERLKTIARMVKNEFGGDLAGSLRESMDREKHEPGQGIRGAKNALKKFPVVGEPGAEKILLFAKLAPVAAVPSAFVHAPLRLWFGDSDRTYTAGYRAAQTVVAAELPETFEARQRAYLLLKRHGQEVCKRSKPRCEVCPVSGMCVYFQETQPGT